ncbi:Crp/Fnr family transcriptional regulator [Billgrantia endophytica]|uniref:Crp/Fnr family transcriptional regulator n=1 Tax=Billgrantia endophytica TaxID=2033802 RepID=A0A2N7U9C5_9GAMM|nr:Crp/Fnr family transcriptional regulator [Halomonas endophytica]PMR77020.1 Crp/Fnr family transcriptional regulator [Halomonas endophytica]
MDQEDSCIVRHFNYYLELSKEDKNLLFDLEKSPTNIKSGMQLWEEGDRAREFCTLSAGWAYSYRHLENGSRQIFEIFLPGDIIGLREFAFSERLAGVQMAEDGVICHFPHQHILELIRRSYTLTTVLFAISSRQQVLLTERLVNLARRNARQKLSHLLLEMYQRLQQTEAVGSGSFRLPLSQELLADLLGLSSVHVSRTFTALGEDGLVYRERHRVTIPDLEALKREVAFDNRYLIDNMRPLFNGH